MSAVSNPVMEAPSVPTNAAIATTAAAAPVKHRVPVMIDEEALIPDWVVDHESYRRWAISDDAPEHGRFSFIDGMIWAGLTTEEFFSHNQMKGEFNNVLGPLVKSNESGYYVPDGNLWSNAAVGISTETDAMFFTYDTLKTERIRLIKGAERGFMEVEGTPDAVLEIVSDSSVRKDTVVLKNKCALAGVREYWLVDARGAEPIFQIWGLDGSEYRSAPNDEGWLRSNVFGKEFKL